MATADRGEAIQHAGSPDSSIGGSGSATLLALLVRQLRYTQPEIVDRLRQRAHGLGIPDGKFDYSVRTLQRHLSGRVKTRPHPIHRLVLEAEFGRPTSELLAPPAVRTPSPYALMARWSHGRRRASWIFRLWGRPRRCP